MFFLINQINFSNKNRARHRVGNASSNRNAGSTKWRLHWGYFRGSSLNLKWSKCGVWWIDQWILTSWLHIEGSRVFTWDIWPDWLYWSIILIGDFDTVIFLCASLIYLFGMFDMLIMRLIILIEDFNFSMLHCHVCWVHWHADYIDWSSCLA